MWFGVKRMTPDISGPMGWLGKSALKFTDCLAADLAFGRAPKWHCNRNSTGPGFECWRPSVFSCVAPSDTHLACPRPEAETDRCPGHRRYLQMQGGLLHWRHWRGTWRLWWPHLFAQSPHYSGPPSGGPVGGPSTEAPTLSSFSSAVSSQLPGSR